MTQMCVRNVPVASTTLEKILMVDAAVGQVSQKESRNRNMWGKGIRRHNVGGKVLWTLEQ